jgi:hypothetical protein
LVAHGKGRADLKIEALFQILNALREPAGRHHPIGPECREKGARVAAAFRAVEEQDAVIAACSHGGPQR